MSGQLDPSPTARFFGGLLMGAGILIAVSSGLCSAALTVGALQDAMRSSSGDVGELITLGGPLVLLFGGIPLGVGIVLFLIGRSLRRGRLRSRRPGLPV